MSRLAAILFFLPLHILACECDSTLTWEQHLGRANVVLLGKCMDVTTNPIKGGLNAIFRVDSSWKRRIEHVVTVHTNPVNQCGFPFKKGKDYLVFARKKHQTLETDICDPNELVKKDGTSAMRRLEAGFGPGRPGLGLKLSLLLVVLGVLGLLFVAFVVLRKRLRGSGASPE